MSSTPSRRTELTAPQRMALLIDILEFERANAQRHKVSRPQITFDGFIDATARRHGLCRASVWNYLRRFRTAEYAALAHRTRRDKDISFYFSRHPKAARLLTRIVISEKMGARASYEFLHRALAHPPSYETVRRERKRLLALHRQASRKGKRHP